MRIPSKGRYAVSAMIDLAIHEKIGPLTIADIAEKQNISLSYLEQLFADLRKNGLVKGTRGPGGGYRLAKTPDNVNIAEIITAVDKKSVEAHKDDEQYLPYILWADLSQQICGFLSKITLAECLNNHNETGQLPGEHRENEQTNQENQSDNKTSDQGQAAA